MIYTEDGAEVALSHLIDVPSFWYASSPYSLYPRGIGAAAVDVSRHAAKLVDAGVSVLVPIPMTHMIAVHGGLDPLDHSVWMPLDEPMMRAAHGIIVVQMEGWRESYGVGVEINAFRAAGKPVLFMPVGAE